jgi:hypothetical protein
MAPENDVATPISADQSFAAAAAVLVVSEPI